MEIIINGSEKVVLNPCSFTYSDYLSLVERVENYRSAEIDPKSIISFGMESNSNIEAREKALNLVVCVAFKDGLIKFTNDNSVHHLFVDPLTYDIYSHNEDQTIKFNVVRDTGAEIDFSVKIRNLKRFLDLGVTNVFGGSVLNTNLPDETYSCCALYLAMRNNKHYLKKAIENGVASIHSANNDAHFATDFFTGMSKVMH